jgi:hypothetical protein
MNLFSSKAATRLALAAACVASAAAGVALDARVANADSYTISPLNAVTMSSGDLDCFDKRYDGLRASGCTRSSVYAYFPIHRDEDTSTSFVGVYLRYSQSSQALYCGLEEMSPSGTWGFVDSVTGSSGSHSTTMGFAYSDSISERGTPYLYCRMYIGDHKIWAIRVVE